MKGYTFNCENCGAEQEYGVKPPKKVRCGNCKKYTKTYTNRTIYAGLSLVTVILLIITFYFSFRESAININLDSLKTELKKDYTNNYLKYSTKTCIIVVYLTEENHEIIIDDTPSLSYVTNNLTGVLFMSSKEELNKIKKGKSKIIIQGKFHDFINNQLIFTQCKIIE